jgi:hypothetical protein
MSTNGQSRMTPMERIHRVYQTAPQRILVPELPDDEGQPLEVFYTPLTGVDDQAIEARDPKTGAERALYRLIHKANDDEGNALFQWRDAPVLLREMPYQVVLRIVSIIMGLEPNKTPTVEAAKKDIQADPNSILSSSSLSSSTSP